ncbi:MAG TPA: queuosine precursor transporter [Sandaracinaceae bacterium]
MNAPTDDALRFDARTKLFLVLAAVFTTCLVVGDVIGGKLVEVPMPGWTVVLTVGMIPFPVTFLLTDLLNEFYGKKAARFVTYVGFGCAVLTYVFIFVGGAIPIASFTREPGWDGVTEEAFANVFLGSQRMILASLTAYMVAQLVDIFAFHALKRMTKGRLLWLRATGSTVISQAVDTVTINFVAWTGVLGFDQIINVIASSYAMKILIAIGLTPLVYAGHAAIERWFGMRPVRVDEDGELALAVEPRRRAG